MPSVTPSHFELHDTKKELELIMDDDYAIMGDLEKLRTGCNAPAAHVHEGLGLEERYRLTRRETTLPILSLKLLLSQGDADLISEGINREKTDIVSSVCILRPWVTESNN
jgi:hypothetical protein